MANAINWFEIPATDFDRAKEFYANILGDQLHESEMGPFKMAFFPADGAGVGGALISGEGCVPSTTGTTAYLNAGDDLDTVLSKVEGAGGSVMVPKSHISDEHGYFAIFTDTEGNKVGLHSPG